MNQGLGGRFPLPPPGQGGVAGDLSALFGCQLLRAGLTAATGEQFGVLFQEFILSLGRHRLTT